MRWNKTNKVLFLALVLFIWQSSPAQGIRKKVNQGNAKYENEKYEEALTDYKDALLDDPLNEIALFNEGDALYKLKKYDQAVEAFQKNVGSKDLSLSAKAFYNIGNSYFKQDKLKESIDFYIKALELNPNDKDAKYNLELARAKLKEQAQKQPQQQQQNQQQQQKQGQKAENKEEQKKEQEKKEQQKQEQGDKKQQANEKEADKNKMKKKEAEQILKALRENEKDAQKKKAPIRADGRYVGKDW